jgi:hypothetical protein
MKKKQPPITYVGTAAAIAFLRERYPAFPLPPGELFAFAMEPEGDDPAYVLVSERDPTLELVGCRWIGDFDIDDHRFDVIQAHAKREARECKIAPPHSVTLITDAGAFSFAVRADERWAVA